MATSVQTLNTAIEPILKNIVNPLIVVAFGFATVVFIYGVIQMIVNEADSEAHTKGRWSMIGGVVGLFIMISAWGIINLVFNTVTTFK